MPDQSNLPDPLQTPELPADTLTPEEHEKALPMVQEEENGTSPLPVVHDESQHDKPQQDDDRHMDRE